MIKKSSESWKLSLATMVPPLTIQDRIHTNDNITPLTRMLNPPAIPQPPASEYKASARAFVECNRTLRQARDTIRVAYEEGLITPSLYSSMELLLQEVQERFKPTTEYPIGMAQAKSRAHFRANSGKLVG